MRHYWCFFFVWKLIFIRTTGTVVRCTILRIYSLFFHHNIFYILYVCPLRGRMAGAIIRSGGEWCMVFQTWRLSSRPSGGAATLLRRSYVLCFMYFRRSNILHTRVIFLSPYKPCCRFFSCCVLPEMDITSGDLPSSLESSADWVYVKNHGYDEEFRILNGSKTVRERPWKENSNSNQT